MRGPSMRTIGLAAAGILMAVFAADFTAAVRAADGSLPAVGERAGSSRFLALGVGRSTVIELPRDAKDVLVANPAIANAVVRSARRAYLIGVAPGQTNIIFFDAEGRQMAAYDIEVGRDASGVREALRRILPYASLKVDAVNDSVVVSGEVANAADAQHVIESAARLVGGVDKVVNALTIRGKEQVLLKVTVAEVQRTVLKQLGVDLTGANISIGSADLNFAFNNLPLTTSSGFDINNIAGGRIDVALRAMEETGVLRTLAEPSLTAISGEAATFLAGGEFPVPGGVTCDNGLCTRTIEFKNFGVGLGFTPIVLSEGRISLKVAAEVSELSNEGAIRQDGIEIPALKVRRANSTVELPSGGALVMAGLIQQQTRNRVGGFPGLMNVPILGTLFRSRDYQRGSTELIIIVTPYAVKATAPGRLARPDDGFADPADPAAVLLGRLNRIYVPGAVKPQRAYYGNYGFILD